MTPSLRPTQPPRLIIDASVLLAWYLPAERFKKAALELLEQAVVDHVILCIPSLTRYEVVNVLALAARGLRREQRLTREETGEILAAFRRAPLEEHPVTGLERRMLEIAITYDRSAYDAAYLALAEALHTGLVTGDASLYRAVHKQFPSVRLLR